MALPDRPSFIGPDRRAEMVQEIERMFGSPLVTNAARELADRVAQPPTAIERRPDDFYHPQLLDQYIPVLPALIYPPSEVSGPEIRLGIVSETDQRVVDVAIEYKRQDPVHEEERSLTVVLGGTTDNKVKNFRPLLWLYPREWNMQIGAYIDYKVAKIGQKETVDDPGFEFRLFGCLPPIDRRLSLHMVKRDPESIFGESRALNVPPRILPDAQEMLEHGFPDRLIQELTARRERGEDV